MASTRVIISGCGIAGPVLAIFLKLKGYVPVIYERGQKESSSGLSLMLQPNGLRVLSLIPDLYEKIPGRRMKNFKFLSVVPEDPGVLANSDIAGDVLPERYGFPSIGTERAKFQQLVRDAAEEHGVEIKYGRQLVSIEQGKDEVRVGFADGSSDVASFVVGCDGLHSNTRIELFGKEQATFTGLTQTGGIAPVPSDFVDSMVNMYGKNGHLIGYQISDTQASWAVTLREPEAKETWRAMDQEKQEEFKKRIFSTWGFGAGDLIKNSDSIIKYGVYDRPELKTWHKDRVVLLGDAAHPTSPHLGQGANQAFEDIYHLVRCLVKYNPDASPPSTDVLVKVFKEYEGIRIARSSTLVQAARQQGEARVIPSVEGCKKRNEIIRQLWKDPETLAGAYDDTMNGPFTGKSEI